MEKKLKVGILGTGKIAQLMAQTLGGMDTAEAWAVGAREAARAAAFAADFHIPRAYGSYEALLADPAVELIYIATPHTFHAAHMKLCLEAGKHVLCEKPFTVTAAQAREAFALAEGKNLLVTEATWTRYMPLAKTLRALCESDRLGTIRGLQANLGYADFGIERIRRPELAGGALLDVGIYTLTFASICFGDDIASMHSAACMSDTGVDIQNSVTLVYRDGKMASLYATVGAATNRGGVIFGDKGYAVVENINNFEGISLYDLEHRLVERIDPPAKITGYEYEVEAAARAIAAGAVECPEMPHAQTVAMMERMDTLRHSWNFWYPDEPR